MMTIGTDKTDRDTGYRSASKWDVVAAWVVVAATLAGLALAG